MASWPPEDHILRQIQDASIDFGDAATSAGLRKIASKLSSLRFATMSDCGAVEVIHDGAGALVDIAISDGALRDYDSRRMADLIAGTAQRGETAVRETLRTLAERAREEAE
jgi:DNA-binding protein YbaB